LDCGTRGILRDSWGRSNVPVGEPFDPPWVFGRPEQAGLDALLFSENSMSAARRPSSCFCNLPHGHPCDRPLVLSCKRYRRTACGDATRLGPARKAIRERTDSYRLSVESVVDVGGSPAALHEKANPRPRSAHHLCQGLMIDVRNDGVLGVEGWCMPKPSRPFNPGLAFNRRRWWG
jgi:hypothetical protein